MYFTIADRSFHSYTVTKREVGDLVVKIHRSQIQLSLNYISLFALCLAILLGAMYFYNPSWTIGIRKKKITIY